MPPLFKILQTFDLSIAYLAGISYQNADALSYMYGDHVLRQIASTASIKKRKRSVRVAREAR